MHAIPVQNTIQSPFFTLSDHVHISGALESIQSYFWAGQFLILQNCFRHCSKCFITGPWVLIPGALPIPPHLQSLQRYLTPLAENPWVCQVFFFSYLSQLFLPPTYLTNSSLNVTLCYHLFLFLAIYFCFLVNYIFFQLY